MEKKEKQPAPTKGAIAWIPPQVSRKKVVFIVMAATLGGIVYLGLLIYFDPDQYNRPPASPPVGPERIIFPLTPTSVPVDMPAGRGEGVGATASQPMTRPSRQE